MPLVSLATFESLVHLIQLGLISTIAETTIYMCSRFGIHQVLKEFLFQRSFVQTSFRETALNFNWIKRYKHFEIFDSHSYRQLNIVTCYISILEHMVVVLNYNQKHGSYRRVGYSFILLWAALFMLLFHFELLL